MVSSRTLSLLLLMFVSCSQASKLSDLVDACSNAVDLCVPLPLNCLNSTVECEALAHVSPVDADDGSIYQFQVASKSNYTYVALGFSNDTKMGDDVVVDCINFANNVSVIAASNNGHSHAQGTEDDAINIISAGAEDSLYCTYQIHNSISFSGFKADLDHNSSYYLLLAVGPVNDTGFIRYHSQRVISENVFLFNSAATSTLTRAVIFISLFSQIFFKI